MLELVDEQIVIGGFNIMGGVWSVEYLGSMTALPQEFLDRGVGQECWAYWLAAEKRWDW